MSRTSDMALDEQVKAEMLREAAPELARALEHSLQYIILSIWDARERKFSPDLIEHAERDLESARAALKRAGIEP